jgi:sugar O-acyltransferase (sialic acid O-acetyltransferase NeuD family)
VWPEWSLRSGTPYSGELMAPATDLIIIGAGGLGREVAQLVAALNITRQNWNLLGFLDDADSLQGAEFEGSPVLGKLHDLATWPPTTSVVVTTGSPRNYFLKKNLVKRLCLPEERFARLVHPTASIGTTVHIGPGSVVLAGVVATADVSVGAHVSIMPGVVLTHDDRVSDYATLASGARLAGGVSVCEGAYIGAGALVKEDITIGEWATIGMGAVVLDDVGPFEVWAGVPARKIRMVEVPPEANERP